MSSRRKPGLPYNEGSSLKIPKPKTIARKLRRGSGGPTLRTQMYLEDDEFLHICSQIRMQAKIHLDMKRGVKEQTPVKYREFREACMKIRGMENYETAWPIDAYVHLFLKQHRRNMRYYKTRAEVGRHGNSTAQKSPVPPTQRAYVLVPKARFQREVESIVRTKQEFEEGQIDSSENEAGQTHNSVPEEELEEDEDDEDRSIAVDDTDRPNELEPGAAMVLVNQLPEGPEGVRQFLESLAPPQGDLLPVFLEEGVINSKYLVAIAKSYVLMTAFLMKLRRERKISFVQDVLLEEALRRLA